MSGGYRQEIRFGQSPQDAIVISRVSTGILFLFARIFAAVCSRSGVVLENRK